jgi:hypothetical protein
MASGIARPSFSSTPESAREAESGDEETTMDPNDALWLANARMRELHAEAAANRLASEGRKASRAQARHRAPAGDDGKSNLHRIVRSWIDRWCIERLRSITRRSASAPTVDGRR